MEEKIMKQIFLGLIILFTVILTTVEADSTSHKKPGKQHNNAQKTKDGADLKSFGRIIKDPGSSGWITTQGKGRIGKLALQTPALIRFGQSTEDEVFISHEAATAGVEIENTGSEPLVGLRYFGPDVHKKVPLVTEFRK